MDANANQIKPWKERLFDDKPELKGQYRDDDSGALDELGLYYAHEEIADLRAQLARQQAAPSAWMTPNDWGREPLATTVASVVAAWRSDSREVTPLYASPAASLAVPDGYKLVLVEPTWEMTRPAFSFGLWNVECECGQKHSGGLSHNKASELFKAMAAASPVPPEQEQPKAENNDATVISILRAQVKRMEEQQNAHRPGFLLNGTRFKLNFSSRGNVDVFHNYAAQLQGRWVALVPAEDDSHLAPVASADAVREALNFAANVIELFDDKTMEGDYMLDAGECAEIIRALPVYFAIKSVRTGEGAAK